MLYFFGLTRRAYGATDLVIDQTRLLDTEIRALIAQGDREAGQPVLLEAASFIMWSIHLALLNARAGALDKLFARFLFERQIPRIALELGTDADELDHIYRRRRIEVMKTIRNVFVRQTGDGELITPITTSSAKLFLNRAMGTSRSKPPQPEEEFAALLDQRCRSVMQTVLERSGTSLPTYIK